MSSDVVVAVLVASLLAASRLGFAERDRIRVSNGCGAYASALLLRRRGKTKANYRTLAEIQDPDGDGVCSLLDIRRGLSRFGVESRAYLSADRELPAGPAILRLRQGVYGPVRGHFVYVERGANSNAVFYAPLGVLTWSDEQLRDCWDGYVIAPVSSGSRLPSLVAGAGLLLALLTVAWFAMRRHR